METKGENRARGIARNASEGRPGRVIGTHTQIHTEISLGTKNIAISDEAYQRLKALKKPGESFTELIERMTRSRGILELSGILSNQEASRVIQVVRETRRESSKRLYRTIERLG
jgi:predicted CopG family antitoxin